MLQLTGMHEFDVYEFVNSEAVDSFGINLSRLGIYIAARRCTDGDAKGTSMAEQPWFSAWIVEGTVSESAPVHVCIRGPAAVFVGTDECEVSRFSPAYTKVSEVTHLEPSPRKMAATVIYTAQRTDELEVINPHRCFFRHDGVSASHVTVLDPAQFLAVRVINVPHLLDTGEVLEMSISLSSVALAVLTPLSRHFARIAGEGVSSYQFRQVGLPQPLRSVLRFTENHTMAGQAVSPAFAPDVLKTVIDNCQLFLATMFIPQRVVDAFTKAPDDARVTFAASCLLQYHMLVGVCHELQATNRYSGMWLSLAPLGDCFLPLVVNSNRAPTVVEADPTYSHFTIFNQLLRRGVWMPNSASKKFYYTNIAQSVWDFRSRVPVAEALEKLDFTINSHSRAKPIVTGKKAA